MNNPRTMILNIVLANGSFAVEPLDSEVIALSKCHICVFQINRANQLSSI